MNRPAPEPSFVTGSTRPTDAALWASVEATLTDVVLPVVTDEFARSSLLQLVSLARFAASRGPDTTVARREAVSDVLSEMNVSVQTDDAVAVYAAASAVLVGAIGSGDPGVATRKEKLRQLLVEHLDADLESTSVLMNGFRGKLPDA